MQVPGTEVPNAIIVNTFERVHKEQLLSILAANNVWIRVLKTYAPIWKKDPNYKSTAKYKSLMAYGDFIKNLAINWYKRQLQFEHAPIAKFPNIFGKFFNEKYAAAIDKTAIDYIMGKQLHGIGVLPLIPILWLVAGIVAVISIAYIVDQTHETNAERGALLDKTKQFAIDMKLTPEQTTAIVQGQQVTEQTASKNDDGILGGGITKMIGLVLLAYVGMNAMNKQKT